MKQVLRIRASYDNGKLVFKDKNLPKVKGDALVTIEAKKDSGKPGEPGSLFAGLYGIWADREDMKDGLTWVQEQREKENLRSWKQDVHR